LWATDPRCARPPLGTSRSPSPPPPLPCVALTPRASLVCSQRIREASSPATLLLARKQKRTEEEESPVPLFKFNRCWHCEPFMGKTAPRCSAAAAFDSVKADADEEIAKVEEGEKLGGSDPAARRAARYFLYRLYVFTTYGKLGHGVRVRVPLCVVEAIRHRLREPGCVCARGGPLAECTQYTGHKDAPDGSS